MNVSPELIQSFSNYFCFGMLFVGILIGFKAEKMETRELGLAMMLSPVFALFWPILFCMLIGYAIRRIYEAC